MFNKPKKPRCFGTKEYNEKTSICENCRWKQKCGKRIFRRKN